MIQTFMDIIILMTFLTQVSSGIEPILRRLQNFNSAIEGQHKSKREERSVTSVAEGQRRQAICEVEESHYQLNSDVAVAARLCKTTGTQPLLGEGYECVQEYLSLSVFSASVPSGCSLSAVNSIRAQLQPLAEYNPRRQDLELPSGLQIVAENRFCESIGENNGNYGLDGRDYFCHQQNLAIKTGQVSTLLPSGCVCYHPFY